MKRITLPVVVSMVAVLCASGEEASTPYDVSGSYVEGCGCTAGACPCEFGQKATGAMGCQGTLFFHVTQGRYGEVALDGLNAVVVLLKPVPHMGKAMGTLEGGIYVDERATTAQREALAALLKAQFGALFGSVAGPRAVPIRLTESGVDAEGLADEYRAEIPGILSLKVTPFKDGTGKRSARINVPESFVAVQYMGTADVHTFSDPEWKAQWDLSGANAFYSPFHFTSAKAM
ncbi:MAG: DUF1326 domain-containing protein [Candidatus Latescibacterota bacterium]